MLSILHALCAISQFPFRKVKIEMVVNQEELKILRLTHSIMTDDELRTHEANLNYAFDLKTNAKVTVLKHKRRKTLKICRKTLGEFQGAASGGRWCRLPYANGVVL